jgi:hypothetical protein
MIEQENYPTILCKGMEIYAVAKNGNKKLLNNLKHGYSSYGTPISGLWVTDMLIHVTTDTGKVIELRSNGNVCKII